MELSVKQLTTIFGVTPMTITNWRNGVDKKKTSRLPHHTRKAGLRHTIYFKWGEVKLWAHKNNVRIVVLPKDLV